VLPGENAAEFEALVGDLMTQYPPQGPIEKHLVHEIAEIIWRRHRLRLGERAVLSRALAAVTANTEGADETARVAMAPAQETARAVYATDEEIAKVLLDLELSESNIIEVLRCLDEISPDSFEKALNILNPEVRLEWLRSRDQPSSLAERVRAYLPKERGLKIFLNDTILPRYHERQQSLENRDLIRQQALGEAVYTSLDALERIARHEVHFDRRVEKKLTMLLTLQERRAKNAEKSVLQNLSENDLLNEPDEPGPLSGIGRSKPGG
jgi:hypothetical protein